MNLDSPIIPEATRAELRPKPQWIVIKCARENEVTRIPIIDRLQEQRLLAGILSDPNGARITEGSYEAGG